MSNPTVAHKQDKSELQKFKLFYEHTDGNRPANTAKTTKQPRS